jgi:hypothetical protein
MLGDMAPWPQVRQHYTRNDDTEGPLVISLVLQFQMVLSYHPEPAEHHQTRIPNANTEHSIRPLVKCVHKCPVINTSTSFWGPKMPVSQGFPTTFTYASLISQC